MGIYRYARLPRDPSIDVATTGSLTKQLPQGVEYLHKFKVLHQDLSPGDYLPKAESRRSGTLDLHACMVALSPEATLASEASLLEATILQSLEQYNTIHPDHLGI
ncbi:hypothetical protein FRB95_013614 [Tulasnella sp. JGI-2019a]|nr:hypothetical protein FRB95_013614 [Tulasnella sp. JGI-2019a]